jgi:hypothetical protein
MRKVILFCVLVCIFSCEKVIHVKPPDYSAKATIQCMLQPDSIPVLFFYKTVPYLNNQIKYADLFIRDAIVTLQSSAGTDSLFIDSVFDRIDCQYQFFYKGNVAVIGNESYTLSISSNGEKYIASCVTNLLKPSIDSVVYTPSFKDLYGEHEGVIVYFEDAPGQNNYYRYEMLRYVDTSVQLAGPAVPVSFCLGNDSIIIRELGRSLYTDEGASGSQIKIVVEPAYTHVQGVRGLVSMESVDKNAYDFFSQLDKQKLTQFNPFVEPVFLREGQFGSRAIGYFSAMTKSDQVEFIFPE